MLPCPTDRRRLLMMARVFLHEFSEFVRAHGDGWKYPSDRGDPSADHQLEAFLERLAVDAGQIDEASEHAETESRVLLDIDLLLSQLMEVAAWNTDRISQN